MPKQDFKPEEQRRVRSGRERMGGRAIQVGWDKVRKSRTELDRGIRKVKGKKHLGGKYWGGGD